LLRTAKGLQVIQNSDGENRLVRMLPRNRSGWPLWRILAQYLTSDKLEQNDWAVTAESLLDIEVTGVHGWRSDVLALCWTRFGEDNDWNPGKLLLSFPDVWLAKEAKRLGSLIPRRESRERQHQTLRYLRFLEWVMEGVKRPGASLVALGRSLGCERDTSPISDLVQRLRKRSQKFAVCRSIVEAAAQEAIGPPVRQGINASVGHGGEISELVGAVHRAFVRGGRLPKNPVVHNGYRVQLS
jgi:hypothetical protein